MVFEDFRRVFFDVGCFSSDQVYAWKPEFDKNNLGRWVKKGLLVKLRRGWYVFPEYLGRAGFELYIANRIYRPSYVSLHSALAFYGLIPEAVVQVTSVTTLKTFGFTNPFGTYSYKSLKPELFFGYGPKPISGDRSVLMASAEKALLDLLYLYPFYRSDEEMEALRLDEDVLQETIDRDTLLEFTARYANRQLEKRMKLLLKTYMS